MLALLIVLGMTACSGGGGSTGSVPATKSSTAAATASVSLSLGSALTSGAATVYPVVLKAIDSTGATITGTYLNPITLATSDGTNTGFSANSAGSSPTATFVVTSSSQVVYFVYDGAVLTSPVTVSASVATAATNSFTFQPGTAGSTSPAAIAISSVSIAANGAPSIVGTSGSFSLTVSAYDSKGALITGTYPAPLLVTTNDSKDLTISVIGGASGGNVTLTSSTQVVVVSYDGAVVPSGTGFSVSTAGAATATALFVPSASSTISVQPVVASITLAPVGPAQIQGSPSEFVLAVTGYDSTLNPISGFYAQPIVVTSNDSTDLQFATAAGGPFSSSISVPSSSTVVYVTYDGASVPSTTAFIASSGSVQTSAIFAPATRTNTSTYIKTLYVSTAGAAPVAAAGSQPVYIQAVDQNGAIFNGAYPSAISVTLNKNTDLDLAIGQYVPAIACDPTASCSNNAAVVVNNSGQVVFANYIAAALVAPTSSISVTTAGIVCNAIPFPLVSSTVAVCQATIAPQSVSQASAARLIPISSTQH